MEELWAFNEEELARAIFESEIPVISAVGHETDVTIADFVADVRAETPTAAAVMAVPDTKELRLYLDFLDSKLQENLAYWVDKKTESLSRLDLEAFRKGILSKVELLSLRALKQKEQMHHQIVQHIERLSTQVEQNRMILEHLNPKSIMKLGYAAISTPDGTLVASTADLKPSDPVVLTLSDGEANATVTKIERKQNG